MLRLATSERGILTRMSEQGRHVVYESGEWEVDLTRRELRMRGDSVPLGGRAFAIFAVLLQSAGKLVTRDELMARVWPETIVEENTLEVHISALRKALGQERETLRTSFGRGYRLVGDWTIRQDRTLEDRIALDATRPAVQPLPSNLPAAAFEVIGRTAAVQQLQDLLSGYRAVTLTGPGGIGKTTLALEVARSLLAAFDGACWLVDVVSLSDPNLVPSMVAGALGLKLGGDQISPESVARALGGRRLLLVLDNCEHVIDAAARLAETIQHRCPAASIVATSREVLRFEGEQVYRVLPLEVPEQHHEESVILGHSAVQLFIARARAMDPDFAPHDEKLRAIAAICRHLDGIPLAIEFAAARAAMLGPELVLSRLDERFALLTGGRRTALPRHQTLRATLDWSYELLPEPERCLLRRLGVFAAGFTLEAANAVMNDKGYAPSVLLDQIANLVAKSLIALDGTAPAGRWRLLETTRAYALEVLAESGEAEQVTQSCAEFFRDLVAVGQSSQVPPTAEDMARYGREIDNVRAVLDWSFSPAADVTLGIVLTAAYAPVWLYLSLVFECRDRIERALDVLESDSNVSAHLAMQLQVSLGIALVYTLGSVERIRKVLAKALSAAESLDDVGAMLEILFALYGVYHHSGECRKAQSAAERFSRVALRCSDPALAPIAHRLAGNTLNYGGKQREAQHSFECMIEAYVAPEYQRHTIWSRYDLRVMGRATLARVLWLRGLVDQGVAQAEASLKDARIADHQPTLAWVLHYGAFPVALMTGDVVAAGQALAMLKALATSLGAPFWRILAQCLEGKLQITRGEFAPGSVLLRDALDTCERTGWTICNPEFLGALAEGLAGLGKFSEALVTIDRSLASADRGGERWYVAELLRAKGELLLHEAGNESVSRAEGYFAQALEVAREQDALSWELRAAISFARLRLSQNRHDNARRLLAPVYGRFTEGFETADLRSARAVLQSLSSTARL
jgi:predicted ATPase/DNA-binding winged helix-turn-helix (wHTH) protein